MAYQNSVQNALLSEIENDLMYAIFVNTIEKHHLLDGINNIIYLFSGGKDATFGLFFLNKYLRERQMNIHLRAALVTYPTHVYFEENGNQAACFTHSLDFLKSQAIDLDLFYSPVKDLENGAVDGCKICKAARKEQIDKYIDINAYKNSKTALVTGYTLYDILAYLDEFGLMTDFTYDVSAVTDERLNGRIKNCLHKMAIKEELPNGIRIIRPLVVFKESDILRYLIENAIPFTNRPCKVANSKHKRAYFGALNLVDQVDKSSYEGVMRFLESHNVILPDHFDDIQYDNFFTDC